MNLGLPIFRATLLISFSPGFHYRSGTGRMQTIKITAIKRRYGLDEAEIHTAWLLRKYLEQTRINNFNNLSRKKRSSEVQKYRNRELLRLQKSNNVRAYGQVKKNYKKTQAYIHLTLEERRNFVAQVADCVSNWGFARLFAECVDKLHFDPQRAQSPIDEQAFEQVISRFEQYLQNTSDRNGQRNYGLVVHDDNDTVKRKHTQLMREFLRKGTLWTRIERINETPLFVDSQLTSMVQIADLCSYSLRRYLENGETFLFDKIYARADRFRGTTVGIRHFTDMGCECAICTGHRAD